ncbi:gas vesicle protein [Streptomyces sp. Z26]|uniref:gas vesicle protein n=1 Tax=Streptomyces TaxID=1883 RepID=UPI0026AA8D0D
MPGDGTPWDHVPRADDVLLRGFEDEPALAGRSVALIDLLDRLLNGGAVLAGDVVLSVADVDLVHIDLRAVVRSVTADTPVVW